MYRLLDGRAPNSPLRFLDLTAEDLACDGELRADRDRGAAGAACWRGRQDHGMEEQDIADLSAVR